MNKVIYENNMRQLEKKYPVWAQILEENKRKKRNFDVIAEQSYSDETILKVRDHEKIFYLNGKYAPSLVADRWLEKQGQIDKFATIIIVGISNGVHIRKIMESVPKSVNILIYEPSYELFRRAMEEVDLSFIFKLDIPVGIVVEEINGFEVERYFRYLITYDNIISLKIFISGNYKELFPKKMEDFFTFLHKYLFSIQVSWNTVVRYTAVNAGNVFHNLPYLYEGYSVEDLKGILPEDIPVIIVSAGPSLNKNLKDLKKAEGKACIIATDTAMKPLLNEGIIPDLFVIVDGLKPAELFEHKDISKCGMVTMTAVSKEPMDMHKGRKYFYDSNSPYETELIQKIDDMDERKICLTDLPTGGSVATSAYSLGIHMGAKTIILIGQDLALTGNKIHVEGAFKNEVCNIDMDSGMYVEVDAVDGGKVVTRLDYKNYLDWFEMAIKAWSHIQTIDATEGGALIHGTKIMTLKNAIKKYCVKEYNVKWHLARVPRIFSTDEEKEFALGYFEDSISQIETVKKKAKAGIEYYEQIQDLVKSGKQESNEFRDTYKKIKEINQFMETDVMAETVIDSLKGVESTLRPTIYHVKEDDDEEMNDVAEQGKLLLSAIVVASEEIKGMLLETIVPYAKEQKRKEC